MTFAEKLVFLMQLTSTSNKQLAVAANVDPSFISLLRTARRDAPKNINYTKAIAAYFAKKCEGNYQRIALSEALGRKYLQVQMDTDRLAAILLDWLTDGRDQVGQFLNTFERFPLAEPEGAAGAAAPSGHKSYPANCAYYGNEGKRGAINAFVDYLAALPEPGTVLLSSDESMDWLLEEPRYHERLRDRIQLLLQRGFRICRIAAPIHTTEQAFDSLSQLLPLYLTGQVDSYYYPRLRDNVYRRTLAVLPDAAAVVSTSAGGQAVSRSTLLTHDKRFTNALAGEFRDFLAKCRPMMTAYSTAGSSEELLRCMLQFESDKGDRIQQSATLSAITSPPELIQLATQGMPRTEADAVEQTCATAQAVFRQSLLEYGAVDIHSLATAREVRGGRVPIAVTYLRQEGCLYYTPESYAQHLRSILELTESCENYHAVLLPRGAQAHALMVKDGRQALLLRPEAPLTAFEVSQPYVAEACREYLTRLGEAHTPPEPRRQETASRLRQLIRELSQE